MHLQTKKTNMKKTLLLIVSIFTLNQVNAQIQYSSNTESKSTMVQASVDKLSGPRVGMTIISNGHIADQLESNFMTQFGYQFEKQIAGDEQIAGLIEGIVMIGGLEQGRFLPSISGLFGARTATGFEFAIGPNLSLAGAGLVIGIGKTIKMGSINIPINFAFVPSTINRIDDGYYEEGKYDVEGDWIQGDYVEAAAKTGHRFTVTIGFNFRK
jgi:hypothetical protein